MKDIVVLGAGYAGLKTVVELQKKLQGQVNITLVNLNSYHYETTSLHEVAAGNVPADKITFPIKDVINPQTTKLIIDRVVSVDPDKKTVQLAKHDPLTYDYCVLALGFVSETFGIKGAKENALPMTTVDQAKQIDQHIRNQMASYRSQADPKKLQIIICGGGFTGIELAGALADARPRYADLAGIQPNQVQISVVDASKRLLPMFNDQLAAYGLDIVQKLGIKIISEALIQEIQPNSVLYKKTGAADDAPLNKLDGNTIIWTTGVSGSPIVGQSGLPEKRGRVMASPHLTAPDHDDLYVAGDVAAVMPAGGKRPYPTTAQIALSMANYIAEDIKARANGNQRPDAYQYHSMGTVASVGNTRAFGVAGGHAFKAYSASVLKKMIMNHSLLEIGGFKEFFKKGRFDLYH